MKREDNSLDLFPWVRFHADGQSATVKPFGAGKINGDPELSVMACNIEYIPLLCTDCLDDEGNCVECPPPIPHECANSFWNETLVS